MAKSKDDILRAKGPDVETLVLSTLKNRGPQYGYSLFQVLEDEGGSEYVGIGPATVYPALKALELDGFVVGEWQETTGAPRRKEYTLTTEGALELDRRRKKWSAMLDHIRRVLHLEQSI